MDIGKKEKLKSKLPPAYSKLVSCFLFINKKIITKDNLFQINDYHLFPKGIAIYYSDVRNKNNYNVIGFSENKLAKLTPKKILELFENGIFYNSNKQE